MLLTSWPRNLCKKCRVAAYMSVTCSLIMQLLSNSQRTKDLASKLSEFSRKPNHFDDGINCIAFQVIQVIHSFQVPEGFSFS